MAIMETEALRMASGLIQAGLQGGTLKLSGASTSSSKESGKASAEIDAAYLDTLLKALAKSLTTNQN